MGEWWWWMLAAVVVFAAWCWHKESGSWLRMTLSKWLMLTVVAMAALLCWKKETGNWMADGFIAIAVLVMFVLNVLIFRRRRRQGD